MDVNKLTTEIEKSSLTITITEAKIIIKAAMTNNGSCSSINELKV